MREIRKNCGKKGKHIMARYIFKRILMLIPVLLCISFLLFAVMEMASGNAIEMKYADASAEQLQEALHEFGYDRPMIYRYGLWLKNVVTHGDFGESILYNRPCIDLFLERAWATAKLSIASIIIGHLISLPLGIHAAKHQGTLADNSSMVLAILGLSMPNFWLGLLLILWFSLGLHWFPSSGDNAGIASLVLPALTIGTGRTALLTRMTRTSMIDVIRQDYLRTARSKGVPEKTVINKHALRNALIPIVTISFGEFGAVLGGAVLTETVFAWPGVGRLLVDALNQRDTPLLTCCIILITTVGCLVDVLRDVTFTFIDPRVKATFVKPAKRRVKKNVA